MTDILKLAKDAGASVLPGNMTTYDNTHIIFADDGSRSAVEILTAFVSRIRADAMEAGWNAALQCHSERGMAGWSSHKDAYVAASTTSTPDR